MVSAAMVPRLRTAVLAALLLAACAASGAAQGVGAPVAAADDLELRLVRYYTAPDPSLLPGLIAGLSAAGLLEQQTGAQVMTGFIAGLAEGPIAETRRLLEGLPALNRDEQEAILLGVWLSGRPEAAELLADLEPMFPEATGFLADLSRSEPRSAAAIGTEEGAFAVDLHWGRFMATGDPASLERIVEALDWGEAPPEDPRRQAAEAAAVSLETYAILDDRVLATCRRHAGRHGPHATEVLAALIAAAEARRAGPAAVSP